MKEVSVRTVFRKEYTPPTYRIEEVVLDIRLFEQETLVTNRMRIQSLQTEHAHANSIVLLGEELELLELKLEGQIIAEEDYVLNAESLTIAGLPNSFLLESTVRIHPEKNTSLEGIYCSGPLFCTQCEAEGFRKITYFPDRPDVMTCYRTRIEADSKLYPVLLSNGNPVDSATLSEGRHWAVWDDPFPKPCYLFAMVAGDLECLEDHYTTSSGRDILLQIYVKPGNLDRCHHAMRSLKESMAWDEKRFGREYDLDMFMIVAVDDFNAGAMENKGLNIFNSRLVLASPETATDRDFNLVQSVIAHEYFHNWTGNRVTCRDWFQLSLKEGLTVFRDQEFSADLNSRSVKRISDVNLLRTHQFPEDASPMSHPVRPDSYQEINNFYTLTVYEKGAEVIRMIYTLLGETGFRKGMDLYFERHDGQAVTCDDFVVAMEDATETDLKQFRRWYAQSGTPRLHVSSSFDAENKSYTLKVSQSCPDTPGQFGFGPEDAPDSDQYKQETGAKSLQKLPFHLPLAMGLLDSGGCPIPLKLKGENNSDSSETRILNIKKTAESFVFENIKENPVPSLLRYFSAPVELDYEYSNEELGFLSAYDVDEFNRWEAGQRLILRCALNQLARFQEQRPFKLPETLVNAFRVQLERSEHADEALLAQALSFPGESYIGEKMEVIDVEAVHQVRDFLMRELGLVLKQEFTRLYERLEDYGIYRIDPKSMGRRKLKNLCLDYLVRTREAEARQTALSQFQYSTNMSSTMGALSALNDSEGVERNIALDDFEKRWLNEPLVLDKWFTLHATSTLSETLNRVRKLTRHPRFDRKNPNRIRALIGAFAQNNQTGFHQVSGEGYHFIADCVLSNDRTNPMVSARLVGAFSRWNKYDPGRQTLMQNELQRIDASHELSKDVREIVSKTLQARTTWETEE